MREDETIVALSSNAQAQEIIDEIRLNNEENIRFRRTWAGMMQTLFVHNRLMCIEWMKRPYNLPNSSKRTPKGNTKPEGAENCFYVQHERGELPEIY